MDFHCHGLAAFIMKGELTAGDRVGRKRDRRRFIIFHCFGKIDNRHVCPARAVRRGQGVADRLGEVLRIIQFRRAGNAQRQADVWSYLLEDHVRLTIIGAINGVAVLR